MRSAPWRARCRALRVWGGRRDPGSARRPQRHRPMVVDRRPLVAGCRPGDHGVRRAAHPCRLAAGRRAHRRRLLLVRQAPVRVPADRADADAGHLAGLAAPCPPPGADRVLRQPAVAGRHLRHRCRDQGRAALDLGARPFQRAALGVREAQPGRDLGLAAGAEPHRAPGAGLHPLDPAGRRRAGAAGAAARPRHEHRGRRWCGRSSSSSSACRCGSRASARSAARRRSSAPTSCSATCAAASTASSIPRRATTTRSTPRSRPS